MITFILWYYGFGIISLLIGSAYIGAYVLYNIKTYDIEISPSNVYNFAYAAARYVDLYEIRNNLNIHANRIMNVIECILLPILVHFLIGYTIKLINLYYLEKIQS